MILYYLCIYYIIVISFTNFDVKKYIISFFLNVTVPPPGGAMLIVTSVVILWLSVFIFRKNYKLLYIGDVFSILALLRVKSWLF